MGCPRAFGTRVTVTPGCSVYIGMTSRDGQKDLEAAITWIDLTSRDREQMRRVLDLLSEQGTVDEMGLGTIRDAFADALFPGTSSIQTRLRYVLFVPWLYQQLEAKRISSSDIARVAREAEISLIAPLKASGDVEGVIGARAGASLARLPSHVYWAALVRWGIFRRPQSQSWYHTHFESLARRSAEVGRTDDPGVIWMNQPVWHARLPKRPDSFPDEISFALTRAESEFVLGRLEETCPGTLLAWLAREGSTHLAGNFWDDPVALNASAQVRQLVELAERFSLHVEGLPLLYNLLLAETRYAGHGQSPEDGERIERYRAELAQWAVRERAGSAFSPMALWAFMAQSRSRLANPLKTFIEDWSARLAEIGPAAVADDATLRQLVRLREHQLKGSRARLVNKGRLLDWSGQVGVGRLEYRWFRVRQLLIDLHQGFAS
mgnify:CR=1 FL=1